jgi:hypothetical protein
MRPFSWLWIGDDNLVRRVRSTVPASDSAVASTTDFDILEYGVDVVAEAPAADQVSELSELETAFGV